MLGKTKAFDRAIVLYKFEFIKIFISRKLTRFIKLCLFKRKKCAEGLEKVYLKLSAKKIHKSLCTQLEQKFLFSQLAVQCEQEEKSKNSSLRSELR